jgi:hypothetical protein
MTFKLEQILSDPDLRCPQGEVNVQLPKHLPNHMPNHFEAIRDLSHKLRLNNITHQYHGNGLFTIHNP